MKRFFLLLLFVLLISVFEITAGCSPILIKTAKTPDQTSQESPKSQKPLQPVQTQTNNISPFTLDFKWADMNTDLLSPQGLVTDGKPDGHFQVAMYFPETVKIKYIIIRYTEFNAHVQWAWAYNETVSTVGSPLAVFQKGALVLQDTDIGLECSGNVDLDLFIPELNNENGRDTFRFKDNQNISIQINYITKSGDQKELTSTTSVNM